MSTRLEGLDLSRFVAFAGMVVVNFDIVLREPSLREPWIVQLLQGRAAALFVVIAGIGFALGTAGKPHGKTVRRTLVRSTILLALGLANLAIFPADIIHYYAVYFIAALPFLFLPSRFLAGACLLLLVAQVAAILLFDYDAGWDWSSYEYEGLWTVGGGLRNLLFNGWHPVLPWLAFMLWGILLARLDLSAPRVQRRLLSWGLAIALAVEGLSACLQMLSSSQLRILFETEPVPPMPLYMLSAGGWATAVIGGSLLLAPALRGLAFANSAGRQTLTLYLAHIIVGMGSFEALGWLSTRTGAEALAASAIFILLSALYAVAWSRHIAPTGPLEALLRRLSR